MFTIILQLAAVRPPLTAKLKAFNYLNVTMRLVVFSKWNVSNFMLEEKWNVSIHYQVWLWCIKSRDVRLYYNIHVVWTVIISVIFLWSKATLLHFFLFFSCNKIVCFKSQEHDYFEESRFDLQQLQEGVHSHTYINWIGRYINRAVFSVHYLYRFSYALDYIYI